MAHAKKQGVLVLVVGASGVGKDTVINGARKHFEADPAVVFAQRCITRKSDATEDHQPVTDTEFEGLVARGRLALHWDAHGLRYGIPASILDEVAAGRVVVCNISRSVVGVARQDFPNTLVIEIKASNATRAARLAQRGRETAVGIAERLTRDVDVAMQPDVTIPNEGAAAEAIRDFIVTIERTRR